MLSVKDNLFYYFFMKPTMEWTVVHLGLLLVVG